MSDEKLNAAIQQIDVEDAKPGAAVVKLGQDGILKIAIDLNVPAELFIETRVGAYGSLKWAEELAGRWIMHKEIQYMKEKAMAARDKGVIVPQPGVIDISGMQGPK